MPFLQELFGGLKPLISPLPENHSRVQVPSGLAGTSQTIQMMRELVTQGKRDFRVRNKVGEIIQQCRSKNYYCYAKGLYEFCRDKIRYAFDPNGVELLELPYRVLESGIADCDSIVMLLAAMAENIGLQARFVTIKADVKRPNEFSHVFVEIMVPKVGWVAADPTMPDKKFGWKPPDIYPRKVWPASLDQSEERAGDKMSGLGNVVGAEATAGMAIGNEYSWTQDGDFQPMDVQIEAQAGKQNAFYITADMLPADGSLISGLGSFGDDVSPSTYAIITGIMDGNTYRELKAAQGRQHDRTTALNNAMLAINKVEPGPEKDRLVAAWAQANTAHAKAANIFSDATQKYNDIVARIGTVQNWLGSESKPQFLAGLGEMGVISTAAWVAIIGAVTVAALFALAAVINSLRGAEGAARGYLDQLDSALRGAGVAVESSASAFTKVFLVVGLGVLGFVAFKHFKGTGRIKGF